MLIKFLASFFSYRGLLCFAGRSLTFPTWGLSRPDRVRGENLLIPLRPLLAFLSGFAALFLLWGGHKRYSGQLWHLRE